jgi:hypothetical protein
VLAHIVDGKLAKTYRPKGTYSFSAGEVGGATPYCSSANSCILAGTANYATGPGLILSMDGGKVTIAHKISQMSAVSGLDCTSKSYCTLVGYGGGSTPGKVAALASGKVGKVTSVNANLYPVACVSARSCFTFGNQRSGAHNQSLVIPIDHGKPGAPEKIGANVVTATCQGTRCLGLGSGGSYPNVEGTVFTFTG